MSSYAPINEFRNGQRSWLQRLFSFLLIGGFGAIVNIACFFIMYFYVLKTTSGFLAYIVSFVVATEISILANFIPNDRITFYHLPGRKRPWWARYLRFHMTSMGGIGLTLGVSSSLFHLLHIIVILAQAIALVSATGFNFIFHHIFTYRPARVKTIALRRDDTVATMSKGLTE